ncbi:hypothetical protein ET475_12725 [Microbacterium protaetiae]|uniref:Transcriptional regulator, AbiEi antitoxin, Type IV TA system n=1 Tax=Microbacterium protaetiae TaxID=2509458 RepID=A0A4P6EEM0_9MICO|nr:hypothetical protein [Microbacterium protaetiae]QAY60762.1 hypothetical protein ET475_12725 [Microbacterium protaetiae]
MPRPDAAPKATLLFAREQPHDIARLNRDRSLLRVRPGVYVRRDEWASLKPWECYELRVEAVASTWSSPVFCLESAAPSLELPVFGEPRFIHLLSSGPHSWREGDVIVHGTRDQREIVVVDGMSVVGLRDTAVDLCRVLPPAFALGVADVALRLLRHSDETLDFGAFGRAQANRRGIRQLDWIESHADPLAESTGESLSRAVIEWLGYEEPELQVVFHYEGVEDRSDFYWRRQRKIGESDGYGKYDASNPAAMKEHFVREKKREDRLRRHEDGVIRWDWPDSIRWKPLDRKLAVGGLERVRPMQMSMLSTLAQHPRSFTAKERAERWAASTAKYRDKGIRPKSGATPLVSV